MPTKGIRLLDLDEALAAVRERATPRLEAEAERLGNRKVLHTFSVTMGMALGADQDLESVEERIREADEVGWIVDPKSVTASHDLAVRTGNRWLYLDVPRPADVPTESA